MTGPTNKYQQLAKEAAERINQAAAAGQQLTFLPDEPQAPAADDGKKRGPGKALNQMRDWLASKGYRLPEDILAEVAGLASSQDAVITAIAKTEQIMTWAQDGSRDPDKPTTGQRLALFMQVYTAQLRAAEALLPYGAPKATPDVNVQQAVQIVMPAAPGAGAKVINQPSKSSDIAPPPLPGEIVQNQPLSDAQSDQSDTESRTK